MQREGAALRAARAEIAALRAEMEQLSTSFREFRDGTAADLGTSGGHIDDLRGGFYGFRDHVLAELGATSWKIEELRGFREHALAHLGSTGSHIDDLRGGFYGFREHALKELDERSRRIDGVRAELGMFKDSVAWDHNYERSRIDYALGTLEGMEALRLELIEARTTPEFQAAYEEDEPLITVCTGTAGRPDLLIDRCLSSLRAQTYTNLQILVIGDGCIDDTGERIAALGDPRIEFVNLPERGPYPKPGVERWNVAGMNAANASNRLSRGQFIAFLDDDDSCETNRIEMLLAAARAQRAEFLWHPFWYLQRDGSWQRWGNGRLEHTQITNSSVFYHRFFTKLPWDINAYRIAEPGDWNRFRKIKYLRPRLAFVDEPLTWYHRSYESQEFAPHEGERFLD
ncbi:glycosyltransferase family 2 protein [Ancylobacter amanitiformis]|uniref:Glycosyltransferase 2-like domain-containing protein n=1 Tax=Ancylobacter amanitiformis TaxID=217069 RepID=A0ABU0LTY4_9HYPH|nr:glycosyltransferase family A protein [Ancylobacter amanitiformis]MDQ0512166.1 hypothetical protein [Ancylobacter amanitiformis]